MKIEYRLTAEFKPPIFSANPGNLIGDEQLDFQRCEVGISLVRLDYATPLLSHGLVGIRTGDEKDNGFFV